MAFASEQASQWTWSACANEGGASAVNLTKRLMRSRLTCSRRWSTFAASFGESALMWEVA